MAGMSHERMMKSMVMKVKELCSNVDHDSIQIVLQQYDFNVDQTVQAFLDGTADEMLREWKSLGSSNKTAASKKKKKNKNKGSTQTQESTNVGQTVSDSDHVLPSSHLYNGGIPDSVCSNGVHLDESEAMVVEEKRSRNEPQKTTTSIPSSRQKEDYKQQTKKARDRTISEASTSSTVDKPSKTPHAGLEKSLKDLQRQTIALQRLRVVLNEQVDKSFKRVSEVFKELHNQLNEREAELIFEMDKVKEQANETLEVQQQKAVELKHLTDRAQSMKEAEVAELRSKIKMFVSERKHYEDLSNAQRFVCDFNHMLEELKKFGSVVAVKAAPDHNRRASGASIESSGLEETILSPDKSSPSLPTLTSCPAVKPVAAAAVSTPAVSTPAVSAPVVTAPIASNSSHVLTQSESLTKYEASEMAQRLANLTLNESKEPSANVTSRGRGRGRGSRGRGGHNANDNDREGRPGSSDQPKDHQQTSSRGRGQGQSRGGRGQGRSVRGQKHYADESGTGDNQNPTDPISDKAQLPETSEVNGPSSPKSPSNRQVPRNTRRQGGRQDGDKKTSANSSNKVQSNAKPAADETMTQASGSSADGGKPAGKDDQAQSTSGPNASLGETAEALPQRETRSRRGGGRPGGGNSRQSEATEPVLTNGGPV